jgi:hypothetical protein
MLQGQRSYLQRQGEEDLSSDGLQVISGSSDPEEDVGQRSLAPAEWRLSCLRHYFITFC